MNFAIFLRIFIDLMRNQNFSTLPSGIFPLCHGPNQKNKHGYKYMCQSCMRDGSRPSSMSQNYIYCQTLPRFSCVLTTFCIPSSRENEISQTVRTLGSHIYSRNVYIHRLWHDISRFVMHFFRKKKYIAHETLKMQDLFTFLTPLMRNRKTLKLFFLFNHWLSIRSFGRRVVAS